MTGVYAEMDLENNLIIECGGGKVCKRIFVDNSLRYFGIFHIVCVRN